MEYLKDGRVESKKNIERVGKLPCGVCGREPSDVHHWKSKGSGGGDELSNLQPLCRLHHQEFHQIGAKRFWKKFGKAIKWTREMKGLPPLKGVD